MTNTEEHNAARRAYAERLNQIPLGKGDSLADAVERINQQIKPFQRVLLPQMIDYSTAKEMFRYTAEKHCLRQGNAFLIDDENRVVLQNLIAYFFGFDDHTYLNPHKGIFLYGPVGSGKTFFFQVLQLVFKALSINGYILMPTRRIVQQVEEAKSFLLLNKYSSDSFCFDDLGDEPKLTKIYGQEESIMGHVLTNCYMSYVNRGQLIHATSNLLPQELENHYGSRVADRCRQLFNFVPFGDEKSKSRRT
jgi:hypothetical protein